MKYGLIGEKLGHSFSKEIHELIGGYDYELKEIKKNEIDEFLLERHFTAINVTIPYKETVIPYLDYISPNAALIGAVNTVVNRDGKLYGYNTDFDGMKALILKLGLDLTNKKVLILGTGGTSKTAKAVCQCLKARQIYLVSRNQKPDTISYEEALTTHLDANIIINTTPCGMYPHNEDLIIDIDQFNLLEGVIDAIYNPLSTSLIVNAKAKGIKASGGLYMLVAQAVYAYDIFNSTTSDKKLIDEIYHQIKNNKTNLVLIGMPSCGKTTIGKVLESILHKQFIDTDELIKAKVKMEIKDYFLLYGENQFREIETSVISEIYKQNNLIISTGGGIITRDVNLELLKQNGKIYFIDRKLELLTPTSDRPLSSDYERLKKKYYERYNKYLEGSDVVIENNESIEEAIQKIVGDFK